MEIVNGCISVHLNVIYGIIKRYGVAIDCVKFSDKSACCVIVASGGYPTSYAKGFEIKMPAEVSPAVYVAGAELKDGRLVTSGGRVLGVTAIAPTLVEAIEKSYAITEKISFDGAFYRHDIGKRALAALEEN